MHWCIFSYPHFYSGHTMATTTLTPTEWDQTTDLDLDISLSLNGGKDDPDRDDGDNDSSLDGGNSSTKSTPGNDEDYKMKDCHATPHSNGVSDKNDDSNFS